MEIAIQFERYYLGNDRYIFKPLGVIKGEFDEDFNCFTTDSGLLCQNISDISSDYDYFYGLTTSLELLAKYFPDKEGETELLNEYFDVVSENCYIGFIDYDNYEMDVAKISYESIESIIENHKNDEMLDYGDDNEVEYSVTRGFFETIRDMDSMDEIKRLINQVLSLGDEMEETMKSDDEEEIEEDVEQSKKPKTSKEKAKIQPIKTLDGLQKEVLSKIIGQDKAVKVVTTKLLKNFRASDPENKSHILIAGPTGTGKTEMIKLTCEYLGLPCKSFDATSFTKEGYIGSSVEDMLIGLIQVCDGDIKRAQNGIIIIDEIDKKCSKDSRETASSKDVLDSLLKILGRKKFQIEKGRHGELIDFDTSNLTVILMGAFEGIKKQEETHKKIGFGADNTPKNENNNTEITAEDFIKYGMTPEIMGRIGCIAYTKDLEVEDLVQIIYKSKISPLLMAKKYFEKDCGIKFTYTSQYVKEIAKKAKLYRSGARGIKKAIEVSLEDVDEKVLRKNKIKLIKLTKETAFDNTKYYIEEM